jgi:hypothetical protein
MTEKLQIEKDKLQVSSGSKSDGETEKEKILCSHCLRLTYNGNKNADEVVDEFLELFS